MASVAQTFSTVRSTWKNEKLRNETERQRQATLAWYSCILTFYSRAFNPFLRFTLGSQRLPPVSKRLDRISIAVVPLAHVLVPFKISALHLASYWLEFEKGGRRKQLVNITNLFRLHLQVARQRSSLFLQSDVRRQLLLQTPVLKSHFARDVLQEVHDRRSPCVINMPEINKHIRHAQFSNWK